MSTGKGIIRDAMEAARTLLFIAIAGSLILSASIFLFVFCVDWADWFFGMKLEGLPAGIYLSAKMAGATAIMYLMTRHLRYRRKSVLLVFSYYGFLCLDALATQWKNPQNNTDYPLMILGFFCLAVLLLVVQGTLSLSGEPVTGESP